MNDMTYIYGLVDPRDGLFRYVGKANDVQKRLEGHLADKKTTRKRKWLKQLSEMGLSPSVVILAKVPMSKWQQAEKFQIALFRERGMADLNIAKGGNGHSWYTCSQSTRDKLSRAGKGKKHPPFSEETIRRMSASHKGLLLGRKRPPRSEEWCRKLGEAKIGKKQSIITKLLRID